MKIKNKIYFIILCTILFLTLTPSVVDAKDTQETTNVYVTFTRNGEPAFNEKFVFINLDSAIKKISEGNITSADMNSPTWKRISKNISITKSYKFGPGLTNSIEKAKQILEQISTLDKGKLLVQLNDGTFEGKGYNIKYPGNNTRNYTDDNGHGTGNVPTGTVGVFNEKLTLIKLVTIDKDTKTLNIDLTNKSDQINGEITNLSSDQKSRNRNYVVEFGQQITYKTTIKKEFLQKTGATIKINPQSNLVIDSISRPYVDKDHFTKNAKTSTFGIATNINDNKNTAQTLFKNKFEDKLYTTTIKDYNIKLASQNEDAEIEIQAHLVPTVHYIKEVDKITPTIGKVMIDATVGGEDLNYDQNYFLNLDVRNSEQTIKYQLPTVRSAGINFVAANNNKNTLVKNPKALLGYKKDGKTFVSNGKKWVSFQEDNQSFDLSTVKIFEGGKVYYLGQDKSYDFPLSTELFSFNAKKNKEINQSLFQFYGLAQGRDYVLYYLNNDKVVEEFPFKVYSNQKISQSGVLYNNNSLMFATSKNYNINNLIPSYRAGMSEYNVISEKKQTANNVSMMIYTTIAASCAFVIIIGIIVVKWG